MDANHREVLRLERAMHEAEKQMEMLRVVAMLTGEESHLFGRRVRVSIEWIDDAPPQDYIDWFVASVRRKTASTNSEPRQNEVV